MKPQSVRDAVRKGIDLVKKLDAVHNAEDLELFVENSILAYLAEVVIDLENKTMTKEELSILWKKLSK